MKKHPKENWCPYCRKYVDEWAVANEPRHHIGDYGGGRGSTCSVVFH
jgi:hypothetical protein